MMTVDNPFLRVLKNQMVYVGSKDIEMLDGVPVEFIRASYKEEITSKTIKDTFVRRYRYLMDGAYNERLFSEDRGALKRAIVTPEADLDRELYPHSWWIKQLHNTLEQSPVKGNTRLLGLSSSLVSHHAQLPDMQETHKLTTLIRSHALSGKQNRIKENGVIFNPTYIAESFCKAISWGYHWGTPNILSSSEESTEAFNTLWDTYESLSVILSRRNLLMNSIRPIKLKG
jgi:hypothetical protein